MKIGVELKIDVTKINKELLFKGQKGTYLDATVFIDIDQKDQYENNGMITQKAPKDSQGKGNILGNCKVFWSDGGVVQDDHRGHAGSNQANPTAEAAKQSAVNRGVPMDSFDDGRDIPF